jgi:hypothetical protein
MKTLWVRIKNRSRILRDLRNAREIWCFFQVLLFALCVPCLFLFKVTSLSRWLEKRIENGSVDRVNETECMLVLRCIDMAIAFGKPLVRPSCLVLGLTRYHFLRRSGMDVKLCFGAAMDAGGELLVANGHCWLEKNGEPFLEKTDPRLRFLPIYTMCQSKTRKLEPARTR